MSFSQHLVIPDPSGTHALLIDDASGRMLPCVSNVHWVQVEGAQSWVRDRLGLDIVILRCVLVEDVGADEESGDAFLFAENR